MEELVKYFFPSHGIKAIEGKTSGICERRAKSEDFLKFLTGVQDNSVLSAGYSSRLPRDRGCSLQSASFIRDPKRQITGRASRTRSCEPSQYGGACQRRCAPCG